ncbi:unnamed protein product [Heterobilharzia americana]|nr:unnamed protein product [Heterobilharzia americana]
MSHILCAGSISIITSNTNVNSFGSRNNINNIPTLSSIISVDNMNDIRSNSFRSRGNKIGMSSIDGINDMVHPTNTNTVRSPNSYDDI